MEKSKIWSEHNKTAKMSSASPSHTKRLYHADPYLTRFTATITAIEPNYVPSSGDSIDQVSTGKKNNNKKSTKDNDEENETFFGIVLDQTAFYPNSGGQLNDIGQLELIFSDNAENRENDEETVLQVINVVVEEPIGRIVHLIDPKSSSIFIDKIRVGLSVVGEIDWPTRRDYMQQHHGQHLLSAIFQAEAGIETMSFHMNKKISYIDLNAAPIDESVLSRVQSLVNETILSHTRVKSSLHTIAEVNDMSQLRKKLDPKVVQEPIRLIRVCRRSDAADNDDADADDNNGLIVDLQPCCGTHPRDSAEVGSLVILSTERMKKMTRLSFICGTRVTAYASSSAQTLKQMASRLACAPDAVEQAVSASIDSSTQLRKQFNDLEKLFVQKCARELYANRVTHPSQSFDSVVRVMNQYDDLLVLSDLGNMRKLVREPVFASKCIIVLLSINEPSNSVNFMIGASDDLVKDKVIDLRNWIKEIFVDFPGKGGGAATMVQGSFTSTLEADALRQKIESNLQSLGQ